METDLRPVAEIPQSGSAQSIIQTTTNGYDSPRTTRRNMLASELTVSLRQDLLWERQQKTQTANAVKRRHTAHDVANLKQYPDKVHMDKNGDEMHTNYNDCFSVTIHHPFGW